MAGERLPERRYDKRLAIVVPYRDRAEHLRSFIPHMVSYFQRDKLDRQIDVSIHIVEQAGSAPFNRGKLCNTGFMLVRDGADYVAFHDVDYLPIWADYGWSAQPARLIWHGLTLKEDWERFFGAVVLFDKAAFERVNGFPNLYWGWGPEDRELGFRCDFAGLGFERRDGTYMPLPHKHAGFKAPGLYTDEALKTHAVWAARQHNLVGAMAEDGLSALRFDVKQQARIPIEGVETPIAMHHLVDIGAPR